MHKISYTGDGATAQFVFAFPVFQNGDVRVAIDNIVLSTDQYNVNINDSFDGGVVELALTPPTGARVDVFRQIVLNRVIDYQPTEQIRPEDLNTDFNFILEALRDLRNATDALVGNDDYGLL